MRVQHQIEERIRLGLEPKFLRIVNESSKHRVPKDAETHFDVTIVSDHFADARLLERHRRVQKLLSDELAGPVHALSLHTYTSGEWQQKKAASAFPNCAGGDGSATARADSGRIPQASPTAGALLTEERRSAALPPLRRYSQGDSPFGHFTAAFSKKGLAALFFGPPGPCLEELRRQASPGLSAAWLEDKAVAPELRRPPVRATRCPASSATPCSRNPLATASMASPVGHCSGPDPLLHRPGRRRSAGRARSALLPQR